MLLKPSNGSCYWFSCRLEMSHMRRNLGSRPGCSHRTTHILGGESKSVHPAENNEEDSRMFSDLTQPWSSTVRRHTGRDCGGGRRYGWWGWRRFRAHAHAEQVSELMMMDLGVQLERAGVSVWVRWCSLSSARSGQPASTEPLSPPLLLPTSMDSGWEPHCTGGGNCPISLLVLVAGVTIIVGGFVT